MLIRLQTKIVRRIVSIAQNCLKSN